MTANNTIKYVIKTDNDRTYSLYIIDAEEYRKGKYVGIFLFYDDDDFANTEQLWLNLKHRILYENSINDIKTKVIEYADGRNEKLIFLEVRENEMALK